MLVQQIVKVSIVLLEFVKKVGKSKKQVTIKRNENIHFNSATTYHHYSLCHNTR